MIVSKNKRWSGASAITFLLLLQSLLWPSLVLATDVPDDARWQQLQARTENLIEEEDYTAAMETGLQCVLQSERVYKDHDIRRVRSLRLQARAASGAGRYSLAIRAQAKALRLTQEFHDARTAEMARTLYEMGALQLNDHQAERARNFLEGALEIQDAVAGGEHPDTLDTLHLLADVCLRLDELDGAATILDRLIPVLEKTPGNEARLAAELDALGVVRQRRGDLAGAEPLFRRALEIQSRLSGRDSPFAGWCFYRLGVLRLLAGKPAEAEKMLQDGLSRLRPWAGTRDFRVEVSELARAIALHLLQRDGEVATLILDDLDKAQADDDIRPLLGALDIRLLRFVQRDPGEAARLVEHTAAAAPAGSGRLRVCSLLGMMRSLKEAGSGDADFKRAEEEKNKADTAARRELARRQAVAAFAAGQADLALTFLQQSLAETGEERPADREEITIALTGIVHLQLLAGDFSAAREALIRLLAVPEGPEKKRALDRLEGRWQDWLRAVRRKLEEKQ